MSHGKNSCYSFKEPELLKLTKLKRVFRNFDVICQKYPDVFVYTSARFFSSESYKNLDRQIAENIDLYIEFPLAAARISKCEFLKQVASSNIATLAMANLNPLLVLSFLLDLPNNRNPMFQRYVYDILENSNEDLMLFIVPQLTQLLRFDKDGYLQKVLQKLCSSSTILSQLIIFNLRSNLYTDDSERYKDTSYTTFNAIIDLLKKDKTKSQLDLMEREENFFKSLTDISKFLK